MEENKSAVENFFPNKLSLFGTTSGLFFMGFSFMKKDDKLKAMYFYLGCALVGTGVVARAIGKAKEKKETIK